MKIAVFGSDGQLGTDFVATVKQGGHDCVALTIEDVDLTDAPRVEELLRDAPPLTEEQLDRLLATLLRRSSTAADCRTGTAS